jgi:hypothetical protein
MDRANETSETGRNGAALFYCRAKPAPVSPDAAQMFYRPAAAGGQKGKDPQGFYHRKRETPPGNTRND